MRLSKDKIYLFGGFVLLSALFLYLRLKTIGHLLAWDEAWNILSLRAFLSNAAKDPFYWFYRFHPPLYMSIAEFLLPFKDGFAVRLESLSLIFSYATFLVACILSAGIGGWRYASLTGLFLSVMPSSIAYDTWIKRDGLASFFGYFALLLLFKRKYFWCGALLGLALLSKESGIFFVLSAMLLIFVFGEKKPLKFLVVYILKQDDNARPAIFLLKRSVRRGMVRLAPLLPEKASSGRGDSHPLLPRYRDDLSPLAGLSRQTT